MDAKTAVIEICKPIDRSVSHSQRFLLLNSFFSGKIEKCKRFFSVEVGKYTMIWGLEIRNTY